MELLKKIKFTHILLVVVLYMGINIGLKIHELRTIVYGNNEEVTLELLDTFQFEDKLFEFYDDGSSEVLIKLNGTQVKSQSGYYNKDKTRHIFIEDWDKRTIKQNDEILEPVFKLESNKFHSVYIYEFDVNADVTGKSINKTNDIDITSSLVENKQLNIDFDELETMVSSWRKMSSDEKYTIKYKQWNLLVIDGNWDVYSFLQCNFSNFHDYYSFDLIDNDKIIIVVEDNSYELTQDQYDEFVSFITK